MTVTREPGTGPPGSSPSPRPPRADGQSGPADAPSATTPVAPAHGGGGGGQGQPSASSVFSGAIGPMLTGALAIMGVLLLALSANLLFVSGIERSAAQHAGFDSLRGQLAMGTAPVAQIQAGQQLLAVGIPVAILDIPQIGVVNTVVFNGTSGEVLMKGPGLQRDTVMPGQAGVSVIMGRAWSYGGPFGHLGQLQVGDQFTAITGQGIAHYTVSDLRVAGDADPPMPAGQGRLTLETAVGSPFIPSGVLRVDARLTSTVQPTPSLANLGALPASERPMGTDPAAMVGLLLWIMGLIAVGAGAVIAWHRWGRWQAYLVFGPLAMMVGLFTADQVTRLLPNLM